MGIISTVPLAVNCFAVDGRQLAMGTGQLVDGSGSTAASRQVKAVRARLRISD